MAQTPAVASLELLTSWKEIANFLGKGVRTVQRWEATLGLPVIRPADNRSGIVMARPSDLEAWVLNGRKRSTRGNEGQQMESETRTVFTESLRELHRCHAEARALCGQVSAAREMLQVEIARLRLLCQEWDAIRGDLASGKLPSTLFRVN